MLNKEEYIEKKLEILKELLLFSNKQEDAIKAENWEEVTSLVDSRQSAVDRLLVLDDENPEFTQYIPEKGTKIFKDIRLTTDSLISLDKKNAQDVSDALQMLSMQIGENDEKIKVATAYQPTLGEEKNKSKKINTKN